MDAAETIVAAVGGAGGVGGLVGWFARQAFKDMRDALAKLTASVEGSLDRLARLEERSEGRHTNTMRLLDEHGRRIAQLEERMERRPKR